MTEAERTRNEARRALEALSNPSEAVGLGWGYKFGLALVAVTMLLLPIIYVALIGLLGFGVYEYAIHAGGVLFANPTAGGGRGWILRLALYITPLIAGVVTMIFMVKPFFAPRAERRVPLTIEPDEQPDLHRFVNALCDNVGAPRPQRIDVDCQVNASASFRRGLMSFFGSDVVLTLGLPLAAGMSLRQFSGVLAHELGHFTQGGAMRLTYLIRSISHWFARVVYERDAWDKSLEQTAAGSEHWLILLVVSFIRLMVFLSRRVLWLLMVIGHAVSGLMLRQMEYDADRFEAQISGSDAFAETSNRLTELGVGSEMAFGDVRRGWTERRLGDNLPAMIVNHTKRLPAESLAALHRQSLEQKAGWFASHPSTAQRIASAQAEGAPGLIRTDISARVLFRDFDKLCRLASAHHYQSILGEAFDGVTLVPVQQMLDETKKIEQADAVVAGYLGFDPPASRPVFPDYTAHRPSTDRSKDVDRLFAAKDRLADARIQIDPRLEVISAASNRQAQLHALADLRRAEFQFDPAAFEVESATGNAIVAARAKADGQRRQADAALEPTLDAARQRLSVALRLYHAAVVDRHPKAEAKLDRLLHAADALGPGAALIDELLLDQIALDTLLKQLQAPDQQPALVQQLHRRAEQIVKKLRRIREPLAQVDYPFAHGQADRDLAAHLVPNLPMVGQINAVHGAAGLALERWASISRRVQAELIDLAKRAEVGAEKLLNRRQLEVIGD